MAAPTSQRWLRKCRRPTRFRSTAYDVLAGLASGLCLCSQWSMIVSSFQSRTSEVSLQGEPVSTAHHSGQPESRVQAGIGVSNCAQSCPAAAQWTLDDVLCYINDGRSRVVHLGGRNAPSDLPSHHADSTAKPGNEARNRINTVRTIAFINYCLLTSFSFSQETTLVADSALKILEQNLEMACVQFHHAKDPLCVMERWQIACQIHLW